MPGTENKKTVCITGSVWSGRRSAPRHMLVKDGFKRPLWFTTDRPVNDAQYRRISTSKFHLANSLGEVLVSTHYGSSFVGVMREDYEEALAAAERGVLIVGPPEIAAALAEALPQSIIFALKDAQMDLSEHLEQTKEQGRLHRIDVDVLAPGAWTEVHRMMLETIENPGGM